MRFPFGVPVLLLMFCSFLVLGCQEQERFVPKIEQGVLDLSEWNPEEDGPVLLQGEWEFYWSQLVAPESFRSDRTGIVAEETAESAANFIEAPRSWDKYTEQGKAAGPDGFGTYRLRILLPRERKAHRNLYALKLPTFSTAARLFVNGEEMFRVGAVGAGAEKHTPAYRTGLSVFPASEELFDVVVQVSNYSNRTGGLWKGVKFGTEEQIRNAWMGSLFVEIFLLSSILMTAFYHLGLFINRREDRGSLLFSICCLVICARIVVTGETMITLLYPHFNWQLLEKIAYITFYSFPIFATYLMETLREKRRRLFNIVIWPVSVLFILQVLFTPVSVFSRWLWLFQIWFLIPILLGLYVNIRAAWKGREGSWISLIGIFIAVGTLINDVLYAQRIIFTGFFAPIGLLALIFSQSQLLARLFATTFRRVKKLSEDLQTTNVSYARFVPTAFLNQLGKRDIREIGLGDQTEMEMAILFSDIRSFTSLSEQMSPRDNFEFLNSYMGHLTPAIRENHGFIDKYIGDAIMALFPNRPEDAVDAAIGMQVELRQYNHHRVKRGRDPIRAGIGIHFGRLMLGTIGSDERMDGTVISDAVNTASRVEGLTKTYGAYTLVTEALMEKLQDKSKYSYRLVDSVIVKGKSQSLNVYEIIDGVPDYLHELLLATREEFAKGLQAYSAGDLAACRESMNRVLEKNPADLAAKIYLERVSQRVSA